MIANCIGIGAAWFLSALYRKMSAVRFVHALVVFCWLRTGSCFEQIVEYREMDADLFESILLSGQVSVIRGGSKFWPLTNWTCEDFRRHPDMRQYQIERVYGENDGTYVRVCEECEAWESEKRVSGNLDEDGPEFAPLYWQVRGEDSAIELIDRETPNWEFLKNPNFYWKRKAVEIWFSPPSAGAKSHMDAHVQATVVTQLVGRRRWRLAQVPANQPASMMANFLDSNQFPWTPEVTTVLETGDILIFPPGTVHDTLNLNNASCAASITHQLGVPLPATFFRTHMRAFLTLGDTRETWPIILDLASLGFLRARLSGEAPFFETHANLTLVFPHLRFEESNPQPFFRGVFWECFHARQLAGHFADRLWVEYVGFHDLDGDGIVSEAEFVGTATEWLRIELELLEALPVKFRAYRHFVELVEEVADSSFFNQLRRFEQAVRDEHNMATHSDEL